MEVKNFPSQYEPIRELASALYGSIWLVKHQTTQQLYVIKSIYRQHAEKKLFKGEYKIDEDIFFEKEIYHKLLKQTKHDNLIYMVEEIETEDHIFIVLDYCNSGDLCELVQEKKYLDEKTARGYFKGIVQGLQYLHNNKIAHRDISPENILIHNNIPKLCDFGLACSADFMLREKVGKSSYMAPEVTQRDLYDPVQADLWSMGMLLFVMIYGFILCENTKLSNRKFAHLEKVGLRKFLQQEQLEKYVSKEALDLLENLIVVDPKRRISLTEVLEHPWTNGKELPIKKSTPSTRSRLSFKNGIFSLSPKSSKSSKVEPKVKTRGRFKKLILSLFV